MTEESWIQQKRKFLNLTRRKCLIDMWLAYSAPLTPMMNECKNEWMKPLYVAMAMWWMAPMVVAVTIATKYRCNGAFKSSSPVSLIWHNCCRRQLNHYYSNWRQWHQWAAWHNWIAQWAIHYDQKMKHHHLMDQLAPFKRIWAIVFVAKRYRHWHHSSQRYWRFNWSQQMAQNFPLKYLILFDTFAPEADCRGCWETIFVDSWYKRDRQRQPEMYRNVKRRKYLNLATLFKATPRLRIYPVLHDTFPIALHD